MISNAQILASALPLAQHAGRSTSSFWVWLFVLIVGTVLAGVVILVVRRRLLEQERTRPTVLGH